MHSAIAKAIKNSNFHGHGASYICYDDNDPFCSAVFGKPI